MHNLISIDITDCTGVLIAVAALVAWRVYRWALR